MVLYACLKSINIAYFMFIGVILFQGEYLIYNSCVIPPHPPHFMHKVEVLALYSLLWEALFTIMLVWRNVLH